MTDSCHILNRRASALFRDSESVSPYACFVPAGEPDPITSYVLHRARAWQRAKRLDRDLLAAGRLPKSTLAQLRAGKHRVGAGTEERWAIALGFPDVTALRTAAAAWWLATHTHPTTTAQREAISTLIGLGQVTEAQAMSIVADLGAERFRDRSAAWWLDRIAEEAASDRAHAAEAARVERYQAALQQARDARADGARLEAEPAQPARSA